LLEPFPGVPKFVMWDGCSGLGGASEAMVRHHQWLVIRVDSDPDGVLADDWPPFTHKFDVKDIAWNRDGFHFVKPGDMTLLWGSPPCTEFSRAFSAPAPTAEREGRDFSPDLSILEALIELRRRWQPKYWCFENVIGAIPHFEPLLGPPTQIIGPFVLWHNLPAIAVPRDFEHSKYDNDPGSQNPLRSNIRGKLPLELSEAVRLAAQSPTLGEF